MGNAKLREEGARRLRVLDVIPSVVKEMAEDGTCYYSETVGFPGVLYWVSNDEWLEGKVREFEEENDALVYHVIFDRLPFGRCYSFMYVQSPAHDDANWKVERSCLEDGQCYVWCENRDDFFCSEFGWIDVRPANGGVERVG